MDSNIFIFMGFIILIVYLSGMAFMMKAKKDYQPKEKSLSKKTDEPNQEQAFEVIQTLYNNQLINQKEYNQCVTMGIGLFRE